MTAPMDGKAPGGEDPTAEQEKAAGSAAPAELGNTQAAVVGTTDLVRNAGALEAVAMLKVKP
jgi:hypothetical protein